MDNAPQSTPDYYWFELPIRAPIPGFRDLPPSPHLTLVFIRQLLDVPAGERALRRILYAAGHRHPVRQISAFETIIVGAGRELMALHVVATPKLVELQKSLRLFSDIRDLVVVDRTYPDFLPHITLGPARGVEASPIDRIDIPVDRIRLMARGQRVVDEYIFPEEPDDG